MGLGLGLGWDGMGWDGIGTENFVNSMLYCTSY